MEKISVITINYNTPKITRRALECVKRSTGGLNVEIIVIENGSKEMMLPDEWFQNTVQKVIVNDENLGFAKAVNQGIKQSTGQYIVLLNSDAFVKPQTLAELVRCLKNKKENGIAGPKTINKDGSFQASAGKFPTLWSEILLATTLYKKMGSIFLRKQEVGKRREAFEVDWVSGGCMMIKKSLIQKIGLFDERYFFGVEDVDFCYRANKAGWKTIFAPQAYVTHWHAYSSGGTRSTFKLENEMKGKVCFFATHFPEKQLARYAVKNLYKIRMGLLALLRKLR